MGAGKGLDYVELELLVDGHKPALVGAHPVMTIEEGDWDGDGNGISCDSDEIIEGEIGTVGVTF